jgi:hypothetical protein
MAAMSDWLGPAIQGIGALYGAYSARNAANTAAQGGTNALNLQAQMYNSGRADLAPWRQAGQQVLGSMVPQVANGFQQSPGYQFQLDEAMRVNGNRLAGMGLTNSGQAQRESMRIAQGLAAQDYNNYWNRAAGIAGVGQASAGQGAGLGAQYGQTAGNVMQGVGSAYASGQTQAANALMGGANNLAAYWANQK